MNSFFRVLLFCAISFVHTSGSAQMDDEPRSAHTYIWTNPVELDSTAALWAIEHINSQGAQAVKYNDATSSPFAPLFPEAQTVLDIGGGDQVFFHNEDGLHYEHGGIANGVTLQYRDAPATVIAPTLGMELHQDSMHGEFSIGDLDFERRGFLEQGVIRQGSLCLSGVCFEEVIWSYIEEEFQDVYQSKDGRTGQMTSSKRTDRYWLMGHPEPLMTVLTETNVEGQEEKSAWILSPKELMELHGLNSSPLEHKILHRADKTALSLRPLVAMEFYVELLDERGRLLLEENLALEASDRMWRKEWTWLTEDGRPMYLRLSWEEGSLLRSIPQL